MLQNWREQIELGSNSFVPYMFVNVELVSVCCVRSAITWCCVKVLSLHLLVELQLVFGTAVHQTSYQGVF